jgi:hypothetical protein
MRAHRPRDEEYLWPKGAPLHAYLTSKMPQNYSHDFMKSHFYRTGRAEATLSARKVILGFVPTTPTYNHRENHKQPQIRARLWNRSTAPTMNQYKFSNAWSKLNMPATVSWPVNPRPICPKRRSGEWRCYRDTSNRREVWSYSNDEPIQKP